MLCAMSKKVLITDYVWDSLEPERQVLEAAGLEIVAAPDGSEETLADLARDADAIMFCFAQVTAKVLRAATRCLVASRYGIGVDNIDIAEATKLGIVVTNVPDYCIGEVADHAISMILALNRRLGEHDRLVKRGGWADLALNRTMRRMSDATLGVIGFGRIGRAVAERGKAFCGRIVAYDPLIEPGQVVDGVECVEFGQLIEQSDFITLHVPLTPDTEGLIGSGELARMKDDAIIVNCARGGLIDESALAEALAHDQIGGAGLDVLEPAPPSAKHPLFGFDNVIITPHTAFFSQASTLELERRTAREVVRVLNAERPENFINPEVAGRSRANL